MSLPQVTQHGPMTIWRPTHQVLPASAPGRGSRRNVAARAAPFICACLSIISAFIYPISIKMRDAYLSPVPGAMDEQTAAASIDEEESEFLSDDEDI